MIGKLVSHYRILEKLGEGGMGVVYRAEDTKLRRMVALKFLPPELTRDPEARERFVQEAQTASALDHPNICTIHEIDETDGQTFIAMACVDGQSLKDQIASGPLRLDEAVSIALQIAEGLEEAHEKGIVHRDIKSANVMVNTRGQAKIMDFGLAKLAGGAKITRPGTTLGTIAYMSPEQARGEDVDHRTDIWSLGVVLYEMVAGRVPFKADREQAVMYGIMNEAPEPLTAQRTGVPMELERIVGKALAKMLDERYQHVGDMLADLRALRRRLEAAVTEEHLVAAAPGKKSVAVLPLTSLSQNKEDEYFSDGTTEDIITQLSKIRDLRVVSRTSVMLYKESKKNLRQIGKELGVATILEGSVRRSGDRVRIVAQLVDAHTDAHLWAETYDRDIKDIFAIQSDVAEKIAAALKAKLSPDEKELIEKKPTANIEAYDYYLKGREYYLRFTTHDNEVAVDLFKKALGLDHDYALAWAGLGDAYAQRVERYGMEASWLDSAVEAAKKAIELDGNCAEAYKALGLAYYYRGFNGKALQAYERAVELDPNHAPAIANAGITRLMMGEFDKGLPLLRKAIALEPSIAPPHVFLGDMYRQMGDFPEAELWLGKILDLRPDYNHGCIVEARLHVIQGKRQQAKDEVKRAAAANPDNPRVLDAAGMLAGLAGDFSLAKEYYRRAITANPSFDTDFYALSGIGLGHILLREGERDQAEELLAQARGIQEKQVQDGDERSVCRLVLAAISAIEGKQEEALAWLKKAIDAGWRDYQVSLLDPWLENLRDDERFKQMMADIRATLDEMRRRTEAQ
jgi:serine/threonine protein kinase/tetratricopeptide (TPR) repeat protein